MKPSDLLDKAKEVDAPTRKAQLERGWIGHIVGSEKGAPVKTASILALMLGLILGGLVIFRSADPDKLEVLKLIGALFGMVLAYLFGAGSKDTTRR